MKCSLLIRIVGVDQLGSFTREVELPFLPRIGSELCGMFSPEMDRIIHCTVRDEPLWDVEKQMLYVILDDFDGEDELGVQDTLDKLVVKFGLGWGQLGVRRAVKPH